MDIVKLLLDKKVRILALDGRSASGKTTLSMYLKKNIENSAIIHTDDFFPREGMDNSSPFFLDSERFINEVVKNLNSGEDFKYRVFSCKSGTYTKTINVKGKSELLIIEGAYSLSPIFGKYYDYSLFLDVDKAEQKKRIKERNPDKYESFINIWIPREEYYFNKYNIRERADIVLNSDNLDFKMTH